MSDFSFFWHDYETWGANPRQDRAAQFAGIRTDADLKPVDEPVMFYCAPADDVLPAPDACLVTGITPQRARAEGLVEAEFFAAVNAELGRPGTCGVGYNSIRFDDEVTRFGLYRNFFDPYAREWQHGNSRWDVIDMVRLTRALRPAGIRWPVRDDGAPSFRLEDLTAANGIAHQGAHDALADVYATIAIARLVRDCQPRLYDFVFTHRVKTEASALLNWRERKVMLHVSRRIPATLGCISPIVPLAPHPRNRNSVICFDLRQDPDPLLTLDADRLRSRLYTPTAELGEDETRVGLKEIHVNKCPVIVPLSTLTPEAAAEWSIDLDEADRRRDRLAAMSGMAEKLAKVFADNRLPRENDPDAALYDGFLSNSDRRFGEEIRRMPPEGLGALDPEFDDPRLAELLFRYRARNWPATLSAAERDSWDAWRRQRLVAGVEGRSLLGDYVSRLAELRAAHTDAAVIQVLESLEAWPAEIGIAGD